MIKTDTLEVRKDITHLLNDLLGYALDLFPLGDIALVIRDVV